MALTRSSYPVLLLDSTTEQIITCNKSARELFSLENGSMPGLADIAPGALRAMACEPIAMPLKKMSGAEF